MLEDGTSLPPYVSYSAFVSFMRGCAVVGVPAHLARSALPGYSDNVARQLSTACKSLGLTDARGDPTARLRDLAEAFETSAWPGALREMIGRVYPAIMRLRLDTMSPDEVRDAFQGQYKLPEEMQRKIISFFLTAAREAGIELSRDVVSRLKPRGGYRRILRSAVVSRPAKDPSGGQLSAARPYSVQEAMDLLMRVYDPDAMTPQEEQAVFTLMRHLRKRMPS